MQKYKIALLQGNLKVATRFLGRPYLVTGRVVHGRQFGRDLSSDLSWANLLYSSNNLRQNGVIICYMQRGSAMTDKFTIKFATKKDVPLIRSFIKDLAIYLKLTKEGLATEKMLRESLFGKNKHAEVILGYYKKEPVGFALFFHNFSTPLGRPGLYLEDLYIQPKMRGKGFGKKLLIFLARLAKERKCARFVWVALKSDKHAVDFYKKNIGAKAMDKWVSFKLENHTLDKLAKLPL